MDQIAKLSKMCDAKVRFTWPGFSEVSEKCSKPKKGKGKKKRKEGEEPPAAPPRDAPGEGGKEDKKKKLECEACTRTPAARSTARRAALWCCTRCVLMFCGAMRMFVAAAGVLGLCLTVFFLFAPNEDKKP